MEQSIHVFIKFGDHKAIRLLMSGVLFVSGNCKENLHFDWLVFCRMPLPVQVVSENFDVVPKSIRGWLARARFFY